MCAAIAPRLLTRAHRWIGAADHDHQLRFLNACSKNRRLAAAFRVFAPSSPIRTNQPTGDVRRHTFAQSVDARRNWLRSGQDRWVLRCLHHGHRGHIGHCSCCLGDVHLRCRPRPSAGPPLVFWPATTSRASSPTLRPPVMPSPPTEVAGVTESSDGGVHRRRPGFRPRRAQP